VSGGFTRVRGDLLAGAVLVAAVLILQAPVISGARTLLAFPDNSWQSYAWLNFAVRDGAAWDPYQFGGHSFVGELQTALYYPLGQLLSVVAGSSITVRGITAYLIAHMLMAAVFMYAFMRVLGVTRPGAVVGAIAFTMGGYMPSRLVAQANIFVAACWLPLIFLLFHLALRRALWIALPAGAALALSLLAGHIQPPGYALIGIALYGAWFAATATGERRAAAVRAAAAVAITAVIAFAISAVQVLPSLEYQHHAVRFVGANSAFPADAKLPYEIVGYQHIVDPSDLGGFVSPVFGDVDDGRLYVGVVVLLLAGLGAVRAPRRHALFWMGLAVLSLLYSLGHHAGIHRLAYEVVPELDKLREPARALYLADFALAVLAGYGAGSLTARRAAWWPRPRAPVAVKAVVAVVAVAALGVAFAKAVDGRPLSGHREGLEVALALAVVTLAIVAARVLGWVGPAIAGTLLVVVLVLDLVPLDQAGFARTSDYDATTNFYPNRYYADTPLIDFLRSRPGPVRVTNPAGVLPPNAGDVDQIQLLQGHAASLTDELKALLDVGGAPPSPVHDLMNVRYGVVTSADPVAGWRMVFRSGVVRVYENPTALPRAWLASRWEVQPNAAAARERALSPDFDRLHDVVLDARPSAARAAAAGPPGSVAVTDYEPTRIEFEAKSATPAVLVASEMSYPGWSAEVDGGGARVMRADGFLRAVEMPAGSHRVTMTYRPTHWALALILSLTGVAAVLAACAAAWVRARRRQ
jgi:hypothetical protein